MLLAFLSLLTLSGLPFLALSDETVSGNDTAINDVAFVCTPQPGFTRVIFPDAQNCAGAMLALSRRPDIARFHTDGVDDGFRLPTFERYKNCEVLIEGATATTNVQSSWLEIGLAAAHLNQACVVVKGTGIGGVAYTGGPNGRAIKVQLRGYGRRLEDDRSNSTATA
ncbi:MAG: hypothetical protein Q9222_007063 [Ikaeria aurantiellina]